MVHRSLWSVKIEMFLNVLVPIGRSTTTTYTSSIKSSIHDGGTCLLNLKQKWALKGKPAVWKEMHRFPCWDFDHAMAMSSQEGWS